MTSIFLSYGRADDEDFVRRLCKDLVARGFEVWWDRAAMESRGRTFLQELRDAIEQVDRVVAVIGPAAVKSSYVLAEWNHAALFAKAVIPLLRFGDYDLIPPQIDQLHGPDFRSDATYDKALDELERLLLVPVPPLGSLSSVPALPPHFLPRLGLLKQLRETVLADVERPVVITPSQQITALVAMGGAGKSVIAAAFARLVETRRAFGDGVIWLNSGNPANTLLTLRVLGTALGDNVTLYLDPESASARLPALLADHVSLLVVDDVWQVEDVAPVINVLGPRCRLLLTTRDEGLASALGAQLIPLEMLPDGDALELLAKWANSVPEELPATAGRVATECGNLPFALSLCGAMVGDGQPWEDLLGALLDADLPFIDKALPNYRYRNVLRSQRASIDFLTREDPKAAEKYLSLAVFQKGDLVPEAAILTFWTADGTREREVRKLLAILERKALLRLHGEMPHRRMSLHNLQTVYLKLAADDMAPLHEQLLNAYGAHCDRRWWAGPDDGYFFEHLRWHLTQAHREEEATALLFSYEWLRSVLNFCDITVLLADVGAGASNEDRSVRQLEGALALASHILAVDKSQLPSQLCGRLRHEGVPEIRTLLSDTENSEQQVWLRPLTDILKAPGGPLLRTVRASTGDVMDIALTADSVHAISLAYDGTVKKWNISTGEEEPLRPDDPRPDRLLAAEKPPNEKLDLKGADTVLARCSQTGRSVLRLEDGGVRVWNLKEAKEEGNLEVAAGVEAFALTPDGQKGVSVSRDGTINVWNMEARVAERSFHGYAHSPSGIAITPDGRLAVTAHSFDPTLRTWDLEHGTAKAELQGHNGPVNKVLIAADGKRAVSGSGDGTIKIWDLIVDAPVASPAGDASDITALSITNDGRFAVAGSRNLVRVWDIASGKEQTRCAVDGSVCALLLQDQAWQAVVAQDNGALAICGIESGKTGESSQLAGPAGGTVSMVATSDGQRAVVWMDSMVTIWNLRSRNQEWHMQEPSTRWVLSPSGRRTVSAWEGTVKVWDLEERVAKDRFSCFHPSLTALAMPSEDHVLCWSYGGTLQLIDLANGGNISAKCAGVYPPAVAVTADGTEAITFAYDSYELWNLRTMEKMATLTVDGGGYVTVLRCAIAPDGATMLTGDSAGQIHMLRRSGPSRE